MQPVGGLFVLFGERHPSKHKKGGNEVHVLGDGKSGGVVFVVVLEDMDEAENVQVVFVLGALERDILDGRVIGMDFELELVDLSEFGQFGFEKVSEGAVANELDDFDHDGEEVEEGAPGLGGLLLVEEEGV